MATKRVIFFISGLGGSAGDSVLGDIAGSVGDGTDNYALSSSVSTMTKSRKRPRIYPLHLGDYSMPLSTSAEDTMLESGRENTELSTLYYDSADSHEEQLRMPLANYIVGTIEGNVGNPAIQVLGLRAIADYQPLRQSFSEVFIRTVLGVMTRHLYELPVQIQGCRVLCQHFGSDSRAFSTFSAWDKFAFIQLLLTSANLHLKSTEFTMLSIHMLNALASRDYELRQLIFRRKEDLASLIELLETRAPNSCLQRIGMALLSLIAEDDIGRERICEARGFERILHILKLHMGDKSVQCNATASLCWLLHTENRVRNSQSTRIGETAVTECFEVMTILLLQHIQDPAIFGNVICLLIGCLIRNPGRGLIDSENVFALTFKGMDIHKENCKVNRNCLNLLRLLTIDNPEAEWNVCDHHLESIDASMKKFEFDPSIVAEACCVLGNLCTPSNAQNMSRSSVMETVIECQTKLKGHPKVQQSALWFHYQILEHSDTEEADCAFGSLGISNLMLLEHLAPQETENAAG